jgi:hypothetical protein
MKTLLFALLGVTSLWFYREWTWKSWQNQQLHKLSQVEEQVLALKLQHKAEVESFSLLLDQLAQDDKAVLQQCNTTALLKNLSFTFGNVLENSKVEPSSINDYSVFSWKMLWFVTIFSASIWYELYGIYGVTDINISTDETYNKELDSQIRSFLIRHHPLLASMFLFICYLFSWLGWFGLISNTWIVKNIMMWIFAFILSSWAIFAGLNIRQIWKYLPKNVADMKNRCSDLEWWGWFLSRLCGFHDTKSATIAVGWLVSLVWVYWPYRYFYNYVEVCCGSKEQVYIFLINNVAHLAVLVGICYYFYAMLLILPSLNDLHSHPQEQPTFIGRIVMKCLLKYLRPLLKYGMHEQKIGVIVFISVINSVFCFLRLLYFLLFGNLTLYAWLVSWMFFHAHIMFSILGLQAINVLMQQIKVDLVCKEPFVSKFVSSQQNHDGETYSPTQAEELFDTYLSKSAVYALFMEVPTPETLDKDNESDLSGNKVYKAFQVFIQLDILSEKNNDDKTHDESQNDDS